MSHASLCVLSYNRPDALARCLTSIHATADYPFELIVHDDGSTLPTVYSMLHASVCNISTLITNPPGHNQGVGESVRRMFELSSGDYLFKIDQDCAFEPGWLSQMVAVLRHNPRVGTVGGFRYWCDPVDHLKMHVAQRRGHEEVEDYVSSVFGVRRSLWESHRGLWETHSDAFAEDVGFKRRLAEEGYYHALTVRDVVRNDGFGVGPSTVVTAPGMVQPIHHGPKLFGEGR